MSSLEYKSRSKTLATTHSFSFYRQTENFPSPFIQPSPLKRYHIYSTSGNLGGLSLSLIGKVMSVISDTDDDRRVTKGAELPAGGTTNPFVTWSFWSTTEPVTLSVSRIDWQTDTSSSFCIGFFRSLLFLPGTSHGNPANFPLHEVHVKCWNSFLLNISSIGALFFV